MPTLLYSHTIIFFALVFCLKLFSAVNLSTEVTNKLRIYQEHFEKQYIESTKEFYTVHGRACLSENGVQNYMNYVSFRGIIIVLNIQHCTVV